MFLLLSGLFTCKLNRSFFYNYIPEEKNLTANTRDKLSGSYVVFRVKRTVEKKLKKGVFPPQNMKERQKTGIRVVHPVSV